MTISGHQKTKTCAWHLGSTGPQSFQLWKPNVLTNATQNGGVSRVPTLLAVSQASAFRRYHFAFFKNNFLTLGFTALWKCQKELKWRLWVTVRYRKGSICHYQEGRKWSCYWRLIVVCRGGGLLKNMPPEPAGCWHIMHGIFNLWPSYISPKNFELRHISGPSSFAWTVVLWFFIVMKYVVKGKGKGQTEQATKA